MKISQTFLAIGLSSLAAADISSKCDPKTAQFDKADSDQAPFIIQCGSLVWQHLDLNQCFLNQDGNLVYYDNGNAFASYKITEENQGDVLKLAVEKLELNDEGKPRCFGHDAYIIK